MSTDKYLLYRGNLRAVAGTGGAVVFVTEHPEGQPTALYRLDADKLVLGSEALPGGGLCLAADADSVWVGGTDRRVYQAPVTGGAVAARGKELPAPPVALASLSEGRLAVLAGPAILILAKKDGKLLQTLELPAPGTSLAADATGQWLVAGTVKGDVAVFEGESGKLEFGPSESDRLHQGAVTALLFEPDELRFFSAGADQRLLSTHARGKLEPEDRGRGANHTEAVTALLGGPGDRFFSGSKDGKVKSWARAGATRPATLKDGVGKVVGLALVQVHNRPFLVVACEDNTLRFFHVDAAGKFGEATHKVHDAYAWVQNEFARDESARREDALKELARFRDSAGIELLSRQVGKDPDHGLRLLAARLLGESQHPRAAKLMEQWLAHADEAVRLEALRGLRRHLGERDLRPLDLALKVDKADVGKAAVEALEGLAAKDDQALARLVDALNAKTPEVRQAALAGLERVHGALSAEADLLGLQSRHADLRRLALVRLFQRKLLQSPRVQAALRWRLEEPDGDVRRTAFLVSLYTRDRLVPALRERDPELERQLTELETLGPQPASGDKKEEKKEKKEKKGKPAAAAPTGKGAAAPKIGEEDYGPLLQATASRALDTSLRGARGLAVLGDPRAFGLLLQLSREHDATARVEVCRALEALADERSVNRLRSLLHDDEAGVRDAAFSALAQLHAADPLRAAEAGLGAAAEDVRLRGLQVLVSSLRQHPAQSADEPGWQLLVRALNDGAESVRNEAFKAALNLKMAGGGIKTYRFLLQSIHAGVRREVLTEVMAQAGQDWAWNLLLEFFNDHDPALREEAFKFALKKSRELAPLEWGFTSQFVDVRKLAVAELIKKHSPEAQAVLVRALNDPDREVRQQALGDLVHADAREALSQTLASPFPDVQALAAKALARHGLKETLAPLLALVSTPEPREEERQADWVGLVETALEGLAELGDVAALAHVMPLVLHSRHAALRKAAGRALLWVAVPNQLESLRQVLQHSDPEVKYQAALGLAFAGDPLVASLVFSQPASQVLKDEDRLVAALTLGAAGEDPLAVFLDSRDDGLRQQTLLLMLLLEMKAPQGSPTRCLACLSSRVARVRLTSAQAVERFADPTAFRDFVVGRVNDRGDEPAWKVPAETVDTLADLLAHAAPLTRARTGLLLRLLTGKSQAAWNQAWAIHEERFAGEIRSLQEEARRRRPVPLRVKAGELQELAFGAYVGLVRVQAGRAQDAQALQLLVRVRQTALARVLALARAQPGLTQPAREVCVQALGDPNQPVRLQAFEQLRDLGMDRTALGAEALETGHTDLGVKGLELLTAGASAGEGRKVLEQVMLTRTDDLALEAARLLSGQQGAVPVAARALEAASEAVRDASVKWLAAAYDQDAAASKHLRAALESRYQKVREAAALELATKKDPAAFPALVRLLGAAQDPARQRSALGALVALGDARAADAFLDRLENDPGGTALADELLAAAGQFRRPENAARILALVERNARWRQAGIAAVLTVGGFDQPVEDPEEEQDDRRWEEKQFPRHPAVLARLMEKCLALGETRALARLVGAARWARGQEVEPVLAALVIHPDEGLHRAAVEALGWRLRKRQGSPDALLKTLGAKDPVAQFLAAEGLARSGRAEGLSVLLAAVEYVSDLGLRKRAVSALGELSDGRALDLLVRLANEEGHALQEEAAEALGHMGRSARAEEIFQLLERFARQENRLGRNAVKGLRWLNTRAAWELIRRHAASPELPHRDTALSLLGYDDDPATRDVLLRVLSDEADEDCTQPALKSARRLWGPDSLEPNYALLRNRLAGLEESAEDEYFQECLKRVCERGEPRRIFQVLPRALPNVREALSTSLLNRPALPLDEARAALDSPDPATARLAAWILGRAGAKATSSGPALASAIRKWQEAWDERHEKMTRSGAENSYLTGEVTPCLESLLWAAGRLEAATDALVAAVARAGDHHYRPLRRAALAALASGKMTDRVLAALEEVATAGDPEDRALAADALARHDAARAGRLAEKVLSDRVSFNRLAAREGVKLAGTLRAAAGQVHYQGVALPHLIARGDLEGLAAVAENRKLPEATRLGAVEGLGRLARAEAEERLAQIGKASREEKDLRLAAWRALRRSKRARADAKP